MKTKRRYGMIKAAAYYLRYGHWILMLAVMYAAWKAGCDRRTCSTILASFVISFGLLELIGYFFRWSVVFCEMQNTYHQKMTPERSSPFPKEMKRDCIFSGIFFTAMGMLLLFMTFYFM